jgi:hypothetical protein
MSRLQQRRARVRAEYGFDFPDDFYRFWDFLSRLAPLEPLRALDELGVTPVGPFEVLAGRFDGRVSRHSLLLHWRYYADPPEFFTVLAGDTDRLHWGYWLDDPDHGPGGCVASYYASDGLDLEANGDDLFAAVRLHLEYLHADNQTYRNEDPESADEYGRRLERLAELRERLAPFAGGSGVGDVYVQAFARRTSRAGRVIARTRTGLGIVAPRELYRPLSRTDKPLWTYLRKTKNPRAVVEEARQALHDGHPATALKLGQDLWAMGGPRGGYAEELLDEAYAALGRETLRRVLQTHVANRALPSVDILEQAEAPPLAVSRSLTPPGASRPDERSHLGRCVNPAPSP